MGDRARMWLPGKYVILCCRQSSRPFLLFLKLSTVLPYSNKHFRLPSSHSVHVLCGNTAQTGFVPGARSSRDTGGARRETPRGCVPAPHAMSRGTHRAARSDQGTLNYQKQGLQRVVCWGQVCQQEVVNAFRCDWGTPIHIATILPKTISPRQVLSSSLSRRWWWQQYLHDTLVTRSELQIAWKGTVVFTKLLSLSGPGRGLRPSQPTRQSTRESTFLQPSAWEKVTDFDLCS